MCQFTTFSSLMRVEYVSLIPICPWFPDIGAESAGYGQASTSEAGIDLRHERRDTTTILITRIEQRRLNSRVWLIQI